MTTTTQNITELTEPHNNTSIKNSFKTTAHSSTGSEEEEENEQEFDSISQLTPYPAPPMNYQYSYGYPIIPTISPPQHQQQQQQEPIYSINVYNLSRSLTVKQLTEFIVPIIGGDYYRSAITNVQFYMQQGDMKSATIKILGYEVAVRLNNALNGHEFEGYILSSSFGPTIPQPPIYYSVATTTSPHHRSYSSSNSTVLGSPPALAFPIPLLTPQFDELIDDRDSPEQSPSPSEYGIPYAPPPPPPELYHHNPYQFQYLQPTYNRFRYQYANAQSSDPALSARVAQFVQSPPHLTAPLIPTVSNSPPYIATPLPPQQFYVPQQQQPQQQPQQQQTRGGHNRTRSLPPNAYVHPWLATNRFQPSYQQQQSRYRAHNRTRSTNKYAPILDVSDDDDDDDDDDDNVILNETNHLEFSENEHVDKCRLFVGNIPFSTHWQELREYISDKVSGLTRVEIPQQLNGISKGFAIVFFNDAEKALDCIKKLDGKNFQGRELTVRYDRHLKYIRKYNNIHAMMKNGILKPMMDSTTNNDDDQAITTVLSPEKPPPITIVSNEQDEREEDQLARELMSSLKMK